ncbi:TonB-dependent receptor domain-containing protein [Telmatospirillum sp.]|uniref:TonB-dependent receptor n=1 Tax=Telmatospirillum sp. TaxID=2079197 RepID=UPI00283E72DD|nr:TonB-dependent receptor [Telmatospirillum sp.]MDR3435205.1 TonB-dependent receptor [Telmatospirillum sp.]
MLAGVYSEIDSANRLQFRTIGLSMAVLLASTALASAQTLDLGAVGVAGSGGGAVGSQAKPGSAPAVAPTQGSLDAIEPTSIISDKVLRDMTAPTADYATTVKYAPSVVVNSPNGPGASESKVLIRGFPDGQYNITIDGIPFGDTNDETHHSTSFFPASTLGQVILDRGPGYASTIGFATFGGTLGLFSRDLTDERGGEATFSFGSNNTWNYGGTVQSGLIKETGTRFLFNYDRTMTDGALQDVHADHRNYMFKLDQQLGPNFVGTLFSSVNEAEYVANNKITYAQAAKYGKDYALLSDDPTNVNFKEFQVSRKTTDFEYLGIVGDAGFFQLDNKVYTYSYDLKDLESPHTFTTAGPNGGYYSKAYTTAAHLAAAGISTTDIFGALKENRYRTSGDITKLSRDFLQGTVAEGTLRTGLWYEHSGSPRYQIMMDDTRGTAVGDSLDKDGYWYHIQTTLDTVEPFVEYEWKPTPQLTITPGYKNVWLERNNFGNPNQVTGCRCTGVSDATYNRDLGFLSARYRFTPEISAYAQFSQGFQEPSVTYQQIQNPSNNSVKPQTTNNVQAGAIWKNDRFTVDGDAYFINFANYIQQFTLPGSNQTYYSNLGGVYYKGIEAEGTMVVGYGVSLYANGGLLSAQSKGSHLWVGGVPNATATTGIIYDRDSLYGSVMTKFVGDQFIGTQIATSDANKIASYATTDLTIGYHLGDMMPQTKDIRLQLQVLNLFDQRPIFDGSTKFLAGNTALDYGKSTWSWMPGRIFMGTVTVGF